MSWITISDNNAYTSNGCQGNILHSKYSGQCEEDIENNSTVLPCFLGMTRYNNTCCSYHVNHDGTGDLSSLNIHPNNENCNSYTAPYIANALCSGSSSCSFPVGGQYSYTFPVKNMPTVS